MKNGPTVGFQGNKFPRSVISTPALVGGLGSLLGLLAYTTVAHAQLLTPDPGSVAGQITDGHGYCLDLPNGQTFNGNLLHLWNCNSNAVNQTWFMDIWGAIHYGADPSKCVDFPSQDFANPNNTCTIESCANPNQLQLWDCLGPTWPDQIWDSGGGPSSFELQAEVDDGNAICIAQQYVDQTGVAIITNPCSGATSVACSNDVCINVDPQQWYIDNGPKQAFQLQNGNGACLDLPNGDAANGTLLHLWQCDGNGNNQTWFMDGSGAIHYAAAPQFCVDYPLPEISYSTGFVPGFQLQIWDCSDNYNQDIPLVATAPSAAPYGNHTLQIQGPSVPCLEAQNGSNANNTPVQGNYCNGTLGQTWYAVPVGSQISNFGMSGTDSQGDTLSGSINITATGAYNVAGGTVTMANALENIGTTIDFTASCTVAGFTWTWNGSFNGNIDGHASATLTSNGTDSALAANWASIIQDWQSSGGWASCSLTNP